MKFFELKMRVIAPLLVLCGFVCLGSPATVEAQSVPTAAPGWTLLVHASGAGVSTVSGGEALAADLTSGNLFVKSLQDPAGYSVQLARVTPSGSASILATFGAFGTSGNTTLINSDGSGIAVDPGTGGIIVADQVGGPTVNGRIALINLASNPPSVTTLFSLPWPVNPGSNGTGQQQYAPMLTQFGTGPTHLVLCFWDSTTSKLYSVDALAPTTFTTLLALDQLTAAGQHFTTAGNHVVSDSNTQTLLLTDGSTNTVMELNPATSPATTTTLFSSLPGTSATVHPTSIALRFQHVFVQIGNSIYVGNRTGGSLSLVASGFSQLTNLVVGNASSGNGLSLFAVDKSANTVYEISSGVLSEDSTFTPSVLASGLLGPANGVVFRPPTGDLVVSQFLANTNDVSLVNATSGAISAFANQISPDEIAVRSSDGLVAVKTHPFGPIVFYSSAGTNLGSIPMGNPNACITGLAFDGSGNLFVAAGPATSGVCQSTGWNIYQFAGPTPWTATSSTVATGLIGLEGLVFNAAPLPFGSLYAISQTNGSVYQIFLGSTTDPIIATVPAAANPKGIAVDPLRGDIYVSQFQGTNVLRIQPGGGAPSTFATGFSNSLGLGFDTNGNLYVNEYNTGKIWKFSRASFATAPQPVTQGKTNMLTFTNPNPAKSDQISTLLIPASADLGGTATIQYIFVEVDPATLNARLALGSQGDPNFFGGGSVAPGATCPPVSSSNNKCVVQIQKCINADGSVQAICKVREPAGSSDLIQVTFKYTGSLPPNSNPGFLIDYDTPPNNQTLTDITTGFSSDPTGSGGTKTLCSQTFTVNRATPVGGDFSLSLSPSALSLPAGPSSATVTVTSINSFSSPVALGVSDVPVGLSATLSKTSVTPPANGSDSSTTLTVAVSVDASISSITTIIGNLLAGGCIDNAGVANALTSKLSAAQAAIGGGQIQTGINTLTAFKNQVQAQTGKHINTSCTTTFTLIVTGTVGTVVRFASANVSATFNPGTVLLNDVQSLINSLKTSLSSPDPITGFVVNASGAGVPGATVSILNSPSNTVVATTTTDVTGFYYFATTSILTMNSNYTVQVTVPAGFTSVTPSSQPFTWLGSGLAFNFTLN